MHQSSSKRTLEYICDSKVHQYSPNIQIDLAPETQNKSKNATFDRKKAEDKKIPIIS